jgi:hypothetical protein
MKVLFEKVGGLKKNNMIKIAESELILNSRGAIYHLDVRPEELAETVILLATPRG